MEYLWNLDIEKIPLGWKEAYEEALDQYPNGKALSEGKKVFFGRSAKQDGPFVHPVQYKTKLVETFDRHKAKAEELYESQSNDRTVISKLIETDIILFNILWDWVSDDSDWKSTHADLASFDLKIFEDDTHFIDPETYFLEESKPEDPIFPYLPYKYVRLSGQKQYD